MIMLQMTALGICVGTALFMYGHPALAAGFFTGVAASLFNCVMLSSRLQKLADEPAERALPRQDLLVRLMLATLLMLLSHYVADINFFAALAGFFSFQMVLILRAMSSFIVEGLK
ncbi:MAG: ATP synthase subunit I [Sporomusaceae bacterium]|nr:ATP synthase subunit I [Sporomusaceae bacterium]